MDYADIYAFILKYKWWFLAASPFLIAYIFVKIVQPK